MSVIKMASKRVPTKGWAPGGYTCTCADCQSFFIGAKGSSQCADCAYEISEHVTEMLTESQVGYVTYLLDNRLRVREKINGIASQSADISTLEVILKRIELKLRKLGVKVDSFYNGGKRV